MSENEKSSSWSTAYKTLHNNIFASKHIKQRYENKLVVVFAWETLKNFNQILYHFISTKMPSLLYEDVNIHCWSQVFERFVALT